MGRSNDWHHAIGTRAVYSAGFVSGPVGDAGNKPQLLDTMSATRRIACRMWTKVKFLIIPDYAEALAAMRAVRSTSSRRFPCRTLRLCKKPNPEINADSDPFPQTVSVDPRLDKAPFNDIRVRKAMQMAVDLHEIARTHYHGTVEPYPAALASRA